MKLSIKLTLLAVLTATMIFGQAPAEKPAATVHEAKLPTVSAPTTPTSQSLNTSKLWRLATKANNLRMQANQTQQAKAADAADAELQAETEKITSVCSAAGLILGYDQDEKSPTYQDVKCIAKPPAPPPVDAKPAK